MQTIFFDLDKTLIAKNSAHLWLQQEVRLGRVGRLTALRALGWLLRYQLGSSQLDAPMRMGIASLAGRHEDDLRAGFAAFYRDRIRPLLRPGARAALTRHREAGHEMVLLSSTSTYLAEAVCADLRLDGAVCSRFEAGPDGRLTGRPIEPLCFGAGKLHWANAWLERTGGTLADVTFYTDSAADLPVLEAVGHPVAVNPDPRLRLSARRRGWPVEDWGQPDRAAAAD